MRIKASCATLPSQALEMPYLPLLAMSSTSSTATSYSGMLLTHGTMAVGLHSIDTAIGKGSNFDTLQGGHHSMELLHDESLWGGPHAPCIPDA